MLRIFAGIFLAATTAFAFADDLAADRDRNIEAAGWNADLETLLDALAQDYANFEDAYRVRQIDLPAIALRTCRALAAAVDDDERRGALDQLVGSIADPHLTLSFAGSLQATSQKPCAGGTLAPLPTGIRFARSTDFEPIDFWAVDMFPAGLLRLDDRRTIGVIRIGSFAPTAFAGACEMPR